MLHLWDFRHGNDHPSFYRAPDRMKFVIFQLHACVFGSVSPAHQHYTIKKVSKKIKENDLVLAGNYYLPFDNQGKGDDVLMQIANYTSDKMGTQMFSYVSEVRPLIAEAFYIAAVEPATGSASTQHSHLITNVYYELHEMSIDDEDVLWRILSQKSSLYR
jgi:hypothetical protein